MGVIQNSINQTLGSLAIFSRLNPKTEAKIQSEAAKQFDKEFQAAQEQADYYESERIKEELGGVDPTTGKKDYEKPQIEIVKNPESNPELFNFTHPYTLDQVRQVQKEAEFQLGNARAEAQKQMKEQQLQRIKGWRGVGAARKKIEKIEKMEKRGKL